MNDFLLLIFGTTPQSFESDNLKELEVMVCFGDTYRIFDMMTGQILKESKDLTNA